MLKKHFSRLYLYGVWAIAALMFWSFVFNFVTDTTIYKKVVLFADTYAVQDTSLAVALEETKPSGIKMIKVHPFSYAMFTSSDITGADLILIPESDFSEYTDAFVPIGDFAAAHPEYEYYYSDGLPYGIKVYDGETGTGCAETYLTYSIPGETAQDYYLFFGASSTHLGTEDSVDSAAFDTAVDLLALR